MQFATRYASKLYARRDVDGFFVVRLGLPWRPPQASLVYWRDSRLLQFAVHVRAGWLWGSSFNLPSFRREKP
jgi:hypothetical protein